MDFPFRCETCKQISYSQRITEPPRCCEGSTMSQLASICLLIPCPPNETPVHISTPHQDVHIPDGKRWKVACGAKTLPPIHTDWVYGATCKECRKVAQSMMEAFDWTLKEPLEEEEDSSIDFHFEEDLPPPPNPFK